MSTQTTPRAAMLWVVGSDTGMSSKAIWSHMVNGCAERAWGSVYYPLDPDDFGRCYRLLLRVPEWRPRIGEMAVYGPEWAGLAAAWDELTNLYEQEIGPGFDREGRAPKLYARMKDIEDHARRATEAA